MNSKSHGTISGRLFTTVTAKSPEDVKKWVTENEHSIGEALNKDKRSPDGMLDIHFLRLTGPDGSILIPREINQQCKLVHSDYDKTKRMFEWDDNKPTDWSEVNIEEDPSFADTDIPSPPEELK